MPMPFILTVDSSILIPFHVIFHNYAYTLSISKFPVSKSNWFGGRGQGRLRVFGYIYYRCSIVSANDNGVVYSPSIYFCLKCTCVILLTDVWFVSAPSGMPINVVFSTTPTSVRFTWTAIDCISQNGEIEYTVEFQEGSTGTMVPGSVLGLTFTANGLNPAIAYHFRVAGMNTASRAIGPYTATTVVTTDEAGMSYIYY